MNREYVCLAVPSLDAGGDMVHADYLPREEVVRCRDCTSYRAGGKGHAPRCERSIGTFAPDPDGFCAWGERRNER